MAAMKSSSLILQTQGLVPPVGTSLLKPGCQHTGITLKMKPGVILGQQLAVQADSILETIDESLSTVTGSRMIMREQEAAGVCYLCPKCGHISVNYPILKSGGHQNKAEHMCQWYWSNVNMRNLSRLNKIRIEPIHDPGATMHQQAGTDIWHHDTPKKAQKQHHKKVTGK
jgi:hypothetical protein